jgi:hypothetical protein
MVKYRVARVGNLVQRHRFLHGFFGLVPDDICVMRVPSYPFGPVARISGYRFGRRPTR